MEIAITYGCQIADKILEILLRHYQPWYVGMYSNEQKYRLTYLVKFYFNLWKRNMLQMFLLSIMIY